MGWALQPVTAMAAAMATAAMILAGRMVVPRSSATLCGPLAAAWPVLVTG
jgi:hypothetical protein